ncbi:uncharacterized protein LOC129749455 [Uranotaenia lowii]|uniref:uncharacterized protein LOC129749455 n=1 Tax=Uranotaenia lowii TaxID=190385 RepID=UPI002478A4A9|nr:uncharacterized protein LOC129749455 [Uranotaenia lowii]
MSYYENEKRMNRFRIRKIRNENMEYYAREKNNISCKLAEKRLTNVKVQAASNHSNFLNMRLQRSNETYHVNEIARNRLLRREQRMDEFIAHRDRYYNLLIRSNDIQSKSIREFIENRKQMPSYVCASCEGSFFFKSVQKISKQIIDKIMKNENIQNTCDSRTLNYYFQNSCNYLCKTCIKYVKERKIPKLATSWGLKLPPVPECITRLNDIEERIVSPYVAFQKVVLMSKRACNPQLGMKGSAIHVPSSVPLMVSSLPRQLNNLDVIPIPVEFKRHMGHSSTYISGLVRASYVSEALDYLKNTDLYKKHDIQVSSHEMRIFTEEINRNNVINLDDSENQVASSDEGNIRDNQPCSGLEQEVNLNLQFDGLEVDDEFYEHLVDDDDECLLFDFNQQTAQHATIVMAPGQNHWPVSVHIQPDVECFCFPKIFAGKKRQILNKNITRSDLIKWEVRCHTVKISAFRILYLAKIKLESEVLSSTTLTLKKKSNAKGVTVEEALNPQFITELRQHNDGLNFLKHIRCSPSFWSSKKKNLFAMLRQCGKPMFFLTVSAVENKWPELIQGLVLKTTGKQISLLQALNLPEQQKHDLIKENPVYSALYYDFKITELIKLMKQSSGPFQPYKITDFYRRREFQMRGSPHDHMLLFIEDAPCLDLNDEDSIKAFEKFADTFITCQYDADNPLCKYLRHKHTDTCSKGRSNKNTCRFNFPKFVLSETKILKPLPKNEITAAVKRNLQKIKETMEVLYSSKERSNLSFEEILESLDLTKDDYINALRASISKVTIFYKRRSCEVDINSYNPIILNLMESNTDLQLILDEYGVAAYIVDYIAKSESGLSKQLKELQNELDKRNTTYLEKLRTIANKFINSNLMSVSEAIYHCLSIPLSHFSRTHIYISTCKSEDRVVFLKSEKQLRSMCKDSTDIAGKDIITYYAERVDLQNICLAEYAAFYFKTKGKRRPDKNRSEISDEEEDIEETEVDRENPNHKRRKIARILRYNRYKIEQDPDNYYREQLLLFYPWRNEINEIETVNWLEVYNNNLGVITRNRSKFQILSDDVIDKAIEAAIDNRAELENEEISEFEQNQLSKDHEIDILIQGGIDRPKTFTPFVYSAPPKVNKRDLLENLRKLNNRQREIVIHIYKCFKLNKLPFKIFISGSAGVGKSLVISTIYQLITYFLEYCVETSVWQSSDSVKVLLSAFSGKAAFLIGGNTLHSAFALPLTETRNIPDLPMDVANNLRQQLLHCKLIVIDEISMVGSTIFSRIDTRLRQITGVDESFGGLSVITVGDFRQLPPVKDRFIFNPPRDCLVTLDLSPLWADFEFYELTEVMRQKDDLDFVNALNNFAQGTMNAADINVFKSREVAENEVPSDAIRLYYTNLDVDRYNAIKIAESKETEILSLAEDKLTGNLKEEQILKKLDIWKAKTTRDCGGYPYSIQFKKGIKYMVTANLDVSDGIVNGATGVLEFVFCNPQSNKPIIVYLNFDSKKVGRNARLKFHEFTENLHLNKNWTPIERQRYSLTNHFQRDYQITRNQFPLVPCEALTIHKSQGQTYSKVCVDLRKKGNSTRQLIYVALSRVSKLSGLYILGNFPGNMADNPTIRACLKETERLKTYRQLTLSFNNLTTHTGLVIAYQNSRSLRENLKYINADAWYSRCDIIVFSETGILTNDEVNIPNFNIVYRSDRQTLPLFVKSGIAKGIICYAKIGLIISVESHKTVFKANNLNKYVGHTDLVILKHRHISLLTGYKSPKINCNEFISVFNSIHNDYNDPTILIGDFNFNLNSTCDETKKIVKYLNRKNLFDKLVCNEPTTDLGSRLDIVFSNIRNISTGVYESYFSDHKPVFAIIRETVLELESAEFLESEYFDNSSSNLVNDNIHNELFNDPPEEFFNDADILNENSTTHILENEEWSNAELFRNLNDALLDILVTSIDFNVDTEYRIMSLLENYSESLDLAYTHLNVCPIHIFDRLRDLDRMANEQYFQEFVEIEIPRDGNCQFHSISYSLIGNTILSNVLRTFAFRSVLQNKSYFEGRENLLESGSFFNLLCVSCEDSAWGNADTLYALSIILKRSIFVVIKGTPVNCLEIRPPVVSLTPIVMIYGSSHYNVLLPKKLHSKYEFPNTSVINVRESELFL